MKVSDCIINIAAAEPDRYIYALARESCLDDVRYVGQTKKPVHRTQMHLSEHGTQDKGDWVDNALLAGDRIVCLLIEIVRFDLALIAESWWVNELQNKYSLTNKVFTPGNPSAYTTETVFCPSESEILAIKPDDLAMTMKMRRGRRG